MSGGRAQLPRLIAAGIVLVTVGTVLTGCFGGPSKGEYALVDAAAQQLGIAQMGTVIRVEHYGQLQRMSGPGPGVTYNIATADPRAAQTVVDNAVQHGWDGEGDHGASITVAGHYLQLSIVPYQALSPAQKGGARFPTADQAGLILGIDES